MLQIKCETCKQEYWVEGYTIPSSWTEPNEIVIPDSETFEDCCEHIQSGEPYEIIDEEYDDGISD